MSASRAVDAVADALRLRILSETYAVDERLPPERTLSVEMGVSRLTLRAAIARLEGEGLLAARQGSGIRVLDWRRHGGVALLPHLMLVSGHDLFGDVLELRRAIAIEAAARIAVTLSDAQLDELDAWAAELAQETDPAKLAVANMAFARRILELAGNTAYLLLFNTVEKVYEARPDVSEAILRDPDAFRASFGALVQLLRTRQPDLVRQALRAAMEAADAVSVSAMEDP